MLRKNVSLEVALTVFVFWTGCSHSNTSSVRGDPDEWYLAYLRSHLRLVVSENGGIGGSGWAEVRGVHLGRARAEGVDLMRCYELARSDTDLRPKVAYVLMMAESNKYLRAVSVSPDDLSLRGEYLVMAGVIRRSTLREGLSSGYRQDMVDVAQLSTLPEAKMAVAAGLVCNGDVERGIRLAVTATAETPSDALWLALDGTVYIAPESERNAALLAYLDSMTMEGVEAAQCLWRLGVQREEMIEYLRKAAETGPSSVSRRAAMWRSNWE